MQRLGRSCCGLSVIALSLAATPAAARTIDLAEKGETRLVGVERNDFMNGVAPAGDVNADGEPDVLVEGSGGEMGGIVRVFFGPLPRRDTRLDQSPARGFSIYGEANDDFGSFAGPAGDVNGDGMDDVVFVRHGFESRAYVLFGKRSGEDVHLAEFDAGTQGDAGFRIDGDFPGEAGTAGDTDRDGLSEVFVAGHSRVYVVRGKTDPAPVDVTLFGFPTPDPAGYEIEHPERRRRGGGSTVAFAGDANGDGLGDVAVAAGHNDLDWDVWVVLGKPDNADVDVADLGEGGYRLVAPIGESGGLANAGDVNGDDFDDLVAGDASSNLAYVVFGRTETSTVDVYRLGRHGYRIMGPPDESGWMIGFSVAGDEDVNADGLADVLVGALEADLRGRSDAGSVYLLFGKGGTGAIHLRKLGGRGIRFGGEKAGDRLGVRVALSRDVTDDGLPDLLLGAIGRRAQGKVHVISHRMLFRR